MVCFYLIATVDSVSDTFPSLYCLLENSVANLWPIQICRILRHAIYSGCILPFLLSPFLCLVFTVRSSYCLFHLACAHVSVFKSFVEKGMRSHPEAPFPAFELLLMVCHGVVEQARGGDSAGCCLHAVFTSP